MSPIYPHLRFDLGILDLGTGLFAFRTHHRFRTPDDIQLGTAVACGADYIITNEVEMKLLD